MALDPNLLKPSAKELYLTEVYQGTVPLIELQPDELEVLNKKHSGEFLVGLCKYNPSLIRREIESALSVHQWAFTEGELRILRNLVSRIDGELGWLRYSTQIAKQLQTSRKSNVPT